MLWKLLGVFCVYTTFKCPDCEGKHLCIFVTSMFRSLIINEIAFNHEDELKQSPREALHSPLQRYIIVHYTSVLHVNGNFTPFIPLKFKIKRLFGLF